MSIWTHISGSLQLETNPHRNDKLPYGQSQMHLTLTPRKKKEFTVELSSFPLVKNVVKDAIVLLPQGESKLEYFVNEMKFHRMSTSDFFVDSDRDVFHDQLRQKYSQYFEDWSDIQKQVPYSVEYQQNSILTISDSVRDCLANDMLDGVLRFVKTLFDNDIDINAGTFFWHDELGNTCLLTIKYGDITITYKKHQEDTDTYDEAVMTVLIDYDDKGRLIDVTSSDNWTSLTGLTDPLTLMSKRQ